MASLLKVNKVVSLDAGFLMESVFPRLMQARSGAFRSVVCVYVEDDPARVATLDFQSGDTREGAPAAPPDIRLEVSPKDLEAVLSGKSRGAGVIKRVTLESQGGLSLLRALCVQLRPSQKAETAPSAPRELGSDERAAPYVLRGSSGVILKANRPAKPAPPPQPRTVSTGKAPATDPVEFAVGNLATFFEDVCGALEKVVTGQTGADDALRLHHGQVLRVLAQGNTVLGPVTAG